ncbi:hypothetical protein J6590_025974 [Homalodisca vitripennis]|nr:hypothetical protein J6590_025974 [Homalodisca vitripennis]
MKIFYSPRSYSYVVSLSLRACVHATRTQRLGLWPLFALPTGTVGVTRRARDSGGGPAYPLPELRNLVSDRCFHCPQGLSESLGERETQVEDLRSAAEPLQASCSPEVAREIEAAVTEAVTAWQDTVTSLQGLCTRYQNAVQLWKQYKEASQALNQWADSAVDDVDTLDPRQAIGHVKDRLPENELELLWGESSPNTIDWHFRSEIPLDINPGFGGAFGTNPALLARKEKRPLI